MRKYKRDYARIRSHKTKYNFIGPERTRVRLLLKSVNVIEACDALTMNENMRSYIWRGTNCFGDNTSFGECHAREIKYKIIRKIFNSFVGKSFDALMTYIASNFFGWDRSTVARFLYYEFGTDNYRFGHYVESTYSIVDGIIVKNK